jgi:hypothetical protein
MAVVVQHDLYRVRCGCGRCHVADQPAGVAAGPVSYGENLRAFALYLLVRQHLPVERVTELIGEFTGVAVSTGWVHGLLPEAAALVAPALAAIEGQIVAADVVGFDETPLKVGAKGEKATVLSASTERHVLFRLARRDKASFQAFLLSRVAGTVVHDRVRPLRPPRPEGPGPRPVRGAHPARHRGRDRDLPGRAVAAATAAGADRPDPPGQPRPR